MPGAWFEERVILASKNEAVNKINSIILEKFEAQEFCYKSIDSTVGREDAIHYPIEFLNSLNMSGLPSHELKLKVGTPVM